jgi:hypothetical protein
MAFLVSRRDGRFEIRESIATDRGPRARTLATFRVLTPDVLDQAAARAHGSFDAERVRARARALKAPVRRDTAAATARRLIGELHRGQSLPPVLTATLRNALPRTVHRDTTDAVEGAREWIGVDDAARGKALYDLLDLASHIPTRRRPAKLGFPRLSSSPGS